VALIKKGEFSIIDILKCIFYGMIFSFAVMVVMAMAFIFAVKSPDLWEASPVEPPEEIHPFSLLIPLTVCLMYITIYPLIDFLYLALSSESKEGLTIFHKILGKKIINKYNSKFLSVLIAFGFYFGIFLFPPFILSLVGIPLILLWCIWFLVYPLMILTYYGAKGYIAGISNAYLHIPDMNRSLFVGLEDSQRATKEFLDDPISRILIGMMLFVFVWQWISSFQTLIFLFKGEMAISPYSYSGMVFLTLLFGVIGYFTRFWGRKIQYRAIDVYFAAYLMAAVGINVFVNFLIVNINKLIPTLNSWSLTAPISTNFLLFAIPAVIEEIVLIIFTSYYFLARKSTFNINFMHSKIEECGQSFDPIPLFNLIKSNNIQLRYHAEQTLINMYERIPIKIDVDINEIRYKNPLLDGLSDPNRNARRISYKILNQLERDIPEKIIPWIIEALSSSNYEKSISIARSLLVSKIDLIRKIPKDILIKLSNDSEWRLKLKSLKILSKLLRYNENFIKNLEIENLLEDADINIQIQTLKILGESSYSIPTEVLDEKLNHVNKYVRASAIKTLKNIKDDEKKEKLISSLIPLIKDPSNIVRTSIFETLSELENLKKYSLPLVPFYNALEDPDDDLRRASLSVLRKYYDEKSSIIDIDQIIKRIDNDNIENLVDILNLLGDFWDKRGRFWNKDPEKILNTLFEYLKFDDNKVKETVSNIIVKKYELNPDIIFEKLVNTPDTSKYLLKGIISRTLINIAEKYPEDVIPRLNDFRSFDKKEAQINALSALEEIAEKYPKNINLETFVSVLKLSTDPIIKNQSSKILTKVAKVNPKAIQPIIHNISALFEDQETSVKITLTKSLLQIAQESPHLINKEVIFGLFSEKDPFIRETATKILGEIGTEIDNYKDIIDALLNKALIDEEWIVREAAVESLGKIIHQVKNKAFIVERLKPLLDDKKPWVRRSVLNLLSEVEEIEISDLPIDKIKENIDHKNDEVREASAKLLQKYDKEPIEPIFEKIISLLEDPSENVRNKMIASMVSIVRAKGLKNLLSDLLKYLSDEYSIELQQSIAKLLDRVAKYEEADIKKRIISVLEIRCKMSQDQIVCKALHNLKNYL